MRKIAPALIAVILAAGAASAQMKVTQPAQPGKKAGTLTAPGATQPQMNLQAARRITIQDAREAAKDGRIVYVDVRSKQTFDKGHIPGAISIPLSQLRTKTVDSIRTLPPGKMVVTYCACQEEHTAAIAVLQLESYGFKNAAALIGGWNDWQASKFPIEVTR